MLNIILGRAAAAAPRYSKQIPRRKLWHRAVVRKNVLRQKVLLPTDARLHARVASMPPKWSAALSRTRCESESNANGHASRTPTHSPTPAKCAASPWGPMPRTRHRLCGEARSATKTYLDMRAQLGPHRGHCAFRRSVPSPSTQNIDNSRTWVPNCNALPLISRGPNITILERLFRSPRNSENISPRRHCRRTQLTDNRLKLCSVTMSAHPHRHHEPSTKMSYTQETSLTMSLLKCLPHTRAHTMTRPEHVPHCRSKRPT